MSPSGVGEAEPPLRCPHKDGVVDMRFLTHLPAGSGLGGPPLKVRDLSLPLIGAEDTPLTPNGGDTSAIVGGSSEDKTPFVLSDGLPQS